MPKIYMRMEVMTREVVSNTQPRFITAVCLPFSKRHRSRKINTAKPNQDGPYGHGNHLTVILPRQAMRAHRSFRQIAAIRTYATVNRGTMTQGVKNIKPTHVELTASEPRDDSLHRVRLQAISQPMQDVRLVQLRLEAGNRSLKARDLLCPIKEYT